MRRHHRSWLVGQALLTLGLLWLPNEAKANAFWPPLILQNVGLWAIPVTILVEGIVLKVGLRTPLLPSVIASGLANVASAIAGVVTLYPLMRVDSVVQWLVDRLGPLAPILVTLLSIAVSTGVETPVVSRLLKKSIDRRLVGTVLVGNVLTTMATIWLFFTVVKWSS